MVSVEGEDTRVDARCVCRTVVQWLLCFSCTVQDAQGRPSQADPQSIYLCFGWWFDRSHRMIIFLYRRAVVGCLLDNKWCGCVIPRIRLNFTVDLHPQGTLKSLFFSLFVQLCLQGDSRRVHLFQSMLGWTHLYKIDPLISATHSGVWAMVVLMYCSLECEGLHGRWRSSKTFGKNGEIYSLSFLFTSFQTRNLFFFFFFRAAIEEEYSKRLAKLAKMTLGRDEIGYVSLYSHPSFTLSSMREPCARTWSTCVPLLSQL